MVPLNLGNRSLSVPVLWRLWEACLRGLQHDPPSCLSLGPCVQATVGCWAPLTLVLMCRLSHYRAFGGRRWQVLPSCRAGDVGHLPAVQHSLAASCMYVLLSLVTEPGRHACWLERSPSGKCCVKLPLSSGVKESN